MTIEERFTTSYQRVKKRGYIPHYFLQMVAEYGHVEGNLGTFTTLRAI
jgi:hypothetical protein